jgi:hypothetical protein
MKVNQMLRCITKNGKQAYFLRNRVHRSKVDMNRDKLGAACKSLCGTYAWRKFMDKAKEYHDKVAEREVFGKRGALWLDFHGQANPNFRGTTQLGYGLHKHEIESSRLSSLRDYSSIRRVARWGHYDFTDLVKGPHSIGSRLTSYDGNRKFWAVPRPIKALQDGYFRGGYIIKRFGSGCVDKQCTTQYGKVLRQTGVDAVQIEMPTLVRCPRQRDGNYPKGCPTTSAGRDQVRNEYAYAMANIILDFLTDTYKRNKKYAKRPLHEMKQCRENPASFP